MVYVVLNKVIGGLTVCFRAAKQISDTFSLLWNYQKLSGEKLKHKASKLADKYSKDISSEDLVQEMDHLTMVHNANSGSKQLGALAEHKLETLFPKLCASLRMFQHQPQWHQQKRAAASLSSLKDDFRSTMSQDRLNNLARIRIESAIAKQINYDTIIAWKKG